jgi:AraC-like DNA-binding protein
MDLVAEKVRISYSSLNFKCKNFFGITPKELIIIIRMYVCIEVITKSEMTCFEVGLKCGYSDPKTFRENFKKVFKILPNEVIIKADKKRLKKTLLKKLEDYIQEVKIQI